jgi:hypothetical protein
MLGDWFTTGKVYMQRLDYLGDTLPDGYEQWQCGICTAMCNFEAMQQCAKRTNPEAECGFDADSPESNHGCFALIVKSRGASPCPKPYGDLG